MPELPEVEIIKQELHNKITNKQLKKIVVRENRFRWPVRQDLNKILENKLIINCTRRGKYLLIHFEHGIQLIHLGMSGSLKLSKENDVLAKHDHIEWFFENFSLRLNDPRRFGAVIWHSKEDGSIEEHPLIKNLGLEPFSKELDGQYLFDQLKKRNCSIKQALLSGKIVVGTGNIYASESLFKAQINPMKIARTLSFKECDLLANAIKNILYIAIDSGGSSLKNFVNTNGISGRYIEQHACVYNKEGEKCVACHKNYIIKIFQNKRSTYYCPNCQN
ncbi:MAG: bifunctional DNA-formamidopyrimidine glycosylase/DNA-(apurinic or apyrimidinic site) lyase [Candidatus Kinetoplastibacterium crithidii]|nr:MAG: bifunctional DNA-formamidopyrimidine glycosylase/DNA-(apurinic or apyrimidinic site) lyase [Candidatus Kinetoplastibacterium crithidii]